MLEDVLTIILRLGFQFGAIFKNPGFRVFKIKNLGKPRFSDFEILLCKGVKNAQKWQKSNTQVYKMISLS